MQSTVTTKDNFKRVIEVEVPEAELKPHFDKAFQKYRKNVKLEGFRKGKVPLSLIKKLYGDAIREEALDEVVQSVFQEVRQKENLKPVAPAQLDDIKYEAGDGLHFRATVEVVPEIELKHYKSLSVEKEVYQVDEKDVESALEEVREQMAVMQPIEEEAREGHFVLADFQQIDATGIPIIGRKFEDRFIQLTGDDYGKELTDQLLGVKPGESRRIELTSQEDAKNGKKDHYLVNIKEIKEKELPEVDDELAKDVGKFENLAELKADIREKLIQKTQMDAHRRARRSLIDEAIKKNSFDLPESMINNYLDFLVENAQKDSRQKVDEEALREQYRPDAIWFLKWELLKEKIREVENIAVTDEDKDRFISRIAGERGVDEKKLRDSLKNPKTKRQFEEDVLEEKILDVLESNAKIKERKVTRKDLEKGRGVAI